MLFNQHIDEIDSEGNEKTYFANEYKAGTLITIYNHDSIMSEEVTYAVTEGRLPQADH
jgi:hypothetical protein